MSFPILQKQSISFAYGGIDLISNFEIDEAQVGFARCKNGTNLCGENEGDWLSKWIVIGRDNLNGDPIFIDKSDKKYPVYIAPHGDGVWEPTLLSASYAGFLEILKEFSKVSVNREHPIALENNPMTSEEYDKFVDCCRKMGGLADSFFWEMLVSDEEAGIGP